MKAMVNVGHDFDKKSNLDDVAKAVCRVMEAGYEFRMETSVVLAALQAFRDATSISGTTISNSSFYNREAPEDDDV